METHIIVTQQRARWNVRGTQRAATWQVRLEISPLTKELSQVAYLWTRAHESPFQAAPPPFPDPAVVIYAHYEQARFVVQTRINDTVPETTLDDKPLPFPGVGRYYRDHWYTLLSASTLKFAPGQIFGIQEFYAALPLAVRPFYHPGALGANLSRLWEQGLVVKLAPGKWMRPIHPDFTPDGWTAFLESQHTASGKVSWSGHQEARSGQYHLELWRARLAAITTGAELQALGELIARLEPNPRVTQPLRDLYRQKLHALQSGL